MMIFCSSRSSAHGPPFMRRSSNAGSRLARPTIPAQSRSRNRRRGIATPATSRRSRAARQPAQPSDEQAGGRCECSGRRRCHDLRLLLPCSCDNAAGPWRGCRRTTSSTSGACLRGCRLGTASRIPDWRSSGRRTRSRSRPGQQVAGRPQHRRQERERRAGPGIDLPFVAALAAFQRLARRCLCERRIERFEIARRRGLALRLRVEQPVDRLAQGDRPARILSGRRRFVDLGPAVMRSIGRVVERLGGRPRAPPIPGLGEIERHRSGRVITRKVVSG